MSITTNASDKKRLNSYVKWFLVILSTIGLICILIFFSYFYIFPKGTLDYPPPNQQAEINAKIQTLWQRVDSLEKSLDNTPVSSTASLRRELERLENQFMSLGQVETYEGMVMFDREKRADTIMRMATFVINTVTLIFTAFVLVVGFISFKSYEALTKELEKKEAEREKQEAEREKRQEEYKEFEEKMASKNKDSIERHEALTKDQEKLNVRLNDLEKAIELMLESMAENISGISKEYLVEILINSPSLTPTQIDQIRGL
ncbi:hypothetical protein MJD09_26025, partial [bacterium]|nr:hypothetical protein [bacterium]